MRHLLVAIAFAFSSAAAHAACSVDTPVSLFGADGQGNGLLSNDGSYSLTPDSLAGQIIGSGSGDGVAHLKGTADCGNFQKQLDESMALAAAMSAPIWLGDSETFRVSGGVGFTDGDAALGLSAVGRISKNLAGYGGAAVSTGNSDAWVAKAGLSYGW